MNIEELKLVLSAINQVSSDSRTAAIVWMALHYGLQLLQSMFWLGGIVSSVWIIARTISCINEWSEIGRRIVKAYGGNGETYTYKQDHQAVERAMLAARKEKP